LRKRLLKVLADEAYAPDELYGAPDGFRYDYAKLLLDDGDTAGARDMLARLTGASDIARSTLDPRMRNLLPAALDIRAAVEKDLVRYRDAMARHPEALTPRVMAARLLRMLGRPNEAVTLLQSATSSLDDPTAFKDRGEQLNWWWNELSWNYVMLGRYEDAVAALENGAALKESGSLNFSQMINLADLHLRAGHPDAALATLTAFDDPKRQGSPFGMMQLHLERGCAHALAGRPETASPHLEYVRSHEKDDPSALTTLLLCMNRTDEAAASLIRRLEDPEQRTDTLLDLSEFDDGPVPLPPFAVDDRRAALRSRSDVKAAIERAGGTGRFRLQFVY
jgi:tetratricopeptide (TPR) repeat protein